MKKNDDKQRISELEWELKRASNVIQRIHRNDRILTPVEGGFALKPATCNGWLLEGGRLVTDTELAAMVKALGDEQVATGAWILGDK